MSGYRREGISKQLIFERKNIECTAYCILSVVTGYSYYLRFQLLLLLQNVAFVPSFLLLLFQPLVLFFFRLRSIYLYIRKAAKKVPSLTARLLRGGGSKGREQKQIYKDTYRHTKSYRKNVRDGSKRQKIL